MAMADRARSTDKVAEYVLESESPGKTLSRRHPKIKDKFEARRKQLEAVSLLFMPAPPNLPLDFTVRDESVMYTASEGVLASWGFSAALRALQKQACLHSHRRHCMALRLRTDLTMQTMCGIEPCPHRISPLSCMVIQSPINMQEHAPQSRFRTCMHACIHGCRSIHACMLSWDLPLAAVPPTRYNCFGVAELVATVTCITGTRLRPIS
jgi:hypothetical protein